jgi:hypothetical protein
LSRLTPTGFVAANTAIAALASGPDDVYLFFVAADGALQTIRGGAARGFAEAVAMTPKSFATKGASVAASFRHTLGLGAERDNASVFVVAQSGALYALSVDTGGAVTATVALSDDGVHSADARVASARQDDTQVDVFAVTEAGALIVYYASDKRPWTKQAFVIDATSNLAPNASLFTGVQADVQLDVMGVARDGSLTVWAVQPGRAWAGPFLVLGDYHALAPGSRGGTATFRSADVLYSAFVNNAGAVDVTGVLAQGQWQPSALLTSPAFSPRGADVVMLSWPGDSTTMWTAANAGLASSRRSGITASELQIVLPIDAAPHAF